MIDLNHIARYQENNRIEAKKAAGGFPHSLWETYSAFANTIGGLILLGVEEARDKTLRVTGIPDGPGYVRLFWQTVQDPAKVSANILQPQDVTLHTIAGKEVLVISVPQAERHQRPVYIGDSPFTGAYRRDGEGDYHCSPDEVRAMLRDRDDAPADLAVLESRGPEVLSGETLRQFRLCMVMRQPDHPWNTLPDDQFLPAAGILGPGQGGKLHPTLAGLLLLGKRKALRAVFPAFRLEYRETDTGFCLSTLRPGPPENVFSFYTMVSHRLTAVSSLLAQDPGEGEALAGALREAVLNAVLHADYFSRGGLTIQRTAAELTVSNGGLLRVSPEQARAGRAADPRNRGLIQLFSLVRLATGTGRGLHGIYALWARRGWQTPTLSQAFRTGVTQLSLPLPPQTFSSAELTQRQIIAYLTDHVTAGVKTLAQELGLPDGEVQAGLDALLGRDLVVRQGRSYRLRA